MSGFEIGELTHQRRYSLLLQWQKRFRELDHGLGFEIGEMTHKRRYSLYDSYIRLIDLTHGNGSARIYTAYCIWCVISAISKPNR